MTSLQEEFRKACSSLSELDPGTTDLAQQILEQCHSAVLDIGAFGNSFPTQEEVAKRHSFACILYIANGVRQINDPQQSGKAGSKACLASILRAFDVGSDQLSASRLEEFLKELPTVIKQAEPKLALLLKHEVALARHLKLRELQTSFVYSTVLAKKSKDLFRSYFDVSITGQGATDKSSPFFAAWLLFIAAKSKLLPAFPDLVASFNLLICVLNVAISHITKSHRNVDLNDHSLFPVRSESGGADTLQSLCLVNKANLTAVRALMHGMDNMLKDMAVPSEAASNIQPPPDMLTSCSYHQGFMSEPATTAAIADKLDAAYQQCCTDGLDVDERPFLAKAAEAPPTPGPSAAPPSLSRCLVGSPQRAPNAAPRMLYLSPMGKNRSNPPLQTPSPKGRAPVSIFGLAQTPGMPGAAAGFPGTPVSDAMTAASWLHDMSLRQPQQSGYMHADLDFHAFYVESTLHSDQPTQQLLRFFRACDVDMTDMVATRIEQTAQSVFPSTPASEHALQALQAAMTNERRQQGVKLYYNVLEAMLTAEESRTRRTNFTSLLSSNTFHKCLAACAFELVVASYRMVTHTFPAVLERLELHAFDMCKIIDPFIRYEPSTPRELKRHLHSIEEKILESLAWERGSSLYPLLLTACESQQVQDIAKEDGEAKEGSPNGSNDSPDSHPSTPTKRKTSPSASQPSTSNKALKGNNDSSPSQEKVSNRSLPEQSQSGLPGSSQGSEPHAKQEVPEASAQDADSQAMGESQPAPASASEDVMQTPKRGPQSSSAFSAFMTPMARAPGAKQEHASASTALPRGFGGVDSSVSYTDKPCRHIIQEFLRKVLRLAANRLHDLCSRLEIEDAHRDEVETQVYHLVQHIIFQQTSLLYNRHLDQVLLSAIYGICKVAQLKQISFKQIINHYRRQPQAKSDVFRTVVLKQSDVDLQVQHTGDVIAFYNSVFVPAVKTDLLRINHERTSLAKPPATEGLLGASPSRPFNRPEFPPNGFSTPPPASRALQGLSQRPGLHKVSATKKVFVSPLRQSSPQQAPDATPRTRSLYAVVGGSHEPYQSPSRDFDLINGRISGRLPHIIGVQGAPAQSGSSGHSSMDASQSPSVSNSMDLLRQSSTVSGEGRNPGNALQVLKAAAARADQWRAANSGEAAGRADAGEQDEGSDSHNTNDSSHADLQKAQSGLNA